MAQDHAALLLDPRRRGRPASRAPSTSSPATGSWRSSARRSPTRTTRGAPATPPCGCSTTSPSTRPSCAAREGLNFSTRIGINSGEVVAGAIGEGGERRLHGDRPHGRPGAADGGAGRARQGLPDRGTPPSWRAASSSSRTSASSRSRARAGRSGLRAGRGRRRRARGSTSPASAASPASSAAARRWRALRGGARARRGRRGRRRRRRRRTRRRQEPPLPRVRRALPRATGSRSSRRRRQAHGKSIPFMPVLQMLRAFFGIGDRDPERIAREKIAGRALLLDPELRRRPAAALRLPRRPRSRPAGAADERRGAPAGARPTSSAACVNAPNRRKTLVARDRGPALDGRGQRRDAGRAGRARSRGRRRWSLVNFRPEYTPPWAARPPTARSRSSRSAQADTRELLRDLAGEDPSLDGLDELIHERTQGNPFFIEEIVRELAESGYLEGERGAYRLARADRGHRRAGHRAGDPRRPDRPPRPRRQAAAAGRLGGRQGGRRRGAAA